MRVLILGGTRFVGPRLAVALQRAGASVTLLHRGETGAPVPGTRQVVGDRSLPDGLAGLADERFDAVVDLSAYFSDWTRAAIDSLAGRVGHYVFISSGAVYRPDPGAAVAGNDAVRSDPHLGSLRAREGRLGADALAGVRAGRLRGHDVPVPVHPGARQLRRPGSVRALPAGGASSHPAAGRRRCRQPVRVHRRCRARARRRDRVA